MPTPTLTLNAVKRRDLLTLGLILLIAAILRLGEPSIVEFLHDEAMLSLMALDVLDSGDLPLTGINSSVGIPNPPISVYVMMIPYALSGDPLFATLFIAALNVIGVGLLWGIAHRYLHPTTALIAGLTYAVSPWAILYSRKIWAQDYHTPFVLLAVLLGLYGFIEGKRWAQALCLPVLLLGLQIHFAAWALLPLWLVLLWVGRRRLSWIAVLISIILAGLTLLPYLTALLNLLQTDPVRVTNALTSDGRGAGLSLSSDALTYYARLATGYGLETWIAPQNQADLLNAVPPPPLLWFIIGGFMLIGLLGSVIWQRTRPYAALLLAWVLLPLVLFTPTWTAIYPHYFIASIPAFCLLAGVGVAWLLHLLQTHAQQVIMPRFSRGIVLAAFCVLLLLQALWWRGALRFVDVVYTPPEGFGTPFHYLQAVRTALGDTRDVLVVSDGYWLLYDQEPVIWSVMLHRSAECVRTITGDGVAVFPNHPFSVLVAFNAPEERLRGLYETGEPLHFPLRAGEGEYLLYTYDAAPEWDGPPLTSIQPVQFENGAQLTGYALTANRMYLRWSLPGRVARDYQYFGHFLDANGERIGQRDSSLWPGRYWCVGDTLITWGESDLPQATQTLRVGMYTLEPGGGFRNSSIVDNAGNLVGTWVDIPLEGEDGAD